MSPVVTFRKFLTTLANRRRLCPYCGALHLHDPDCFAATLRREDSRSHRAGREFAVVRIALKDRARATGADPDAWTRPVTKNLRLTDLAGRIDASRILVLLTETGEDGARQFSEIIRYRMSRDGIDVETRIYLYPANDDLDDQARLQLLFMPFDLADP